MSPSHHLQSALFASSLQPSAPLTAGLVAEVISRTVERLGLPGCESAMAQEFGDHPETAAERMRWIRRLLASTPVPALGTAAMPCNS